MTEVTEAVKEYQEARKELADAAAAYRHMAEKEPQAANAGEGQPLEGGEALTSAALDQFARAERRLQDARERHDKAWAQLARAADSTPPPEP